MERSTGTAVACLCGGRHHPASLYYVTVVDGKRWRPIAGPFASHGEALTMVEPARRKANELDYQSDFYSFGTIGIRDYSKPGLLNSQLGLAASQ